MFYFFKNKKINMRYSIKTLVIIGDNTSIFNILLTCRPLYRELAGLISDFNYQKIHACKYNFMSCGAFLMPPK